MSITQIVGIGLVAVVISIVLKENRPEFAVFVSIIVGIIILVSLLPNITAIFDYIKNLADKININLNFINILLKITGIAILSEFAVSVCNDANEKAIGSKINIGGKILIISMSLPIIRALLDVILKVLP